MTIRNVQLVRGRWAYAVAMRGSAPSERQLVVDPLDQEQILLTLEPTVTTDPVTGDQYYQVQPIEEP